MKNLACGDANFNVFNTQAHYRRHTAVNWSVKRDLAVQQGLEFNTTQQIRLMYNFPRSLRQQYSNKHIYELELVKSGKS